MNVKNGVLLTDSALGDVKIEDTNIGLHIELRGAVYRYFSKQYLYEGDDLQSYRITLTQRDHPWRDTCERNEC